MASNDLWLVVRGSNELMLIDRRYDSGLLSDTPMEMLRASSPAGRHLRAALGLAVLATLVGASSAAAMPRAEKHEIRHQIEKLENSWRTALLHGNSSAMDALMADDYMAITPTGILESKEQELANLRSGRVRFASIELTDRKIRLYGTTALVTSRAEVKGSRPEGDISGSYRYTRVWVKDARGVWRIVSFEANKIKEPRDH